MKSNFLTLLLVCAALSPAFATEQPAFTKEQLAGLVYCSGEPMSSLTQLTHDAVSEDRSIAENAIHALRGRGPEGLRAMLETHASALNERTNVAHFTKASQPDVAWNRLRFALDEVAQQRDSYASQLFWYTDLEQAKVAAQAQAKPILSLRLLGKLNEEMSCANSRYFRTTLYANAEVARYLSEHFILHWKSVRPAPRVTIDFGDGRKLERTVTGNSIHYILDADGQVVDALPGLYGAQTFLRELKRAGDIARQVAALPAEKREKELHTYQESRRDALKAALETDLQQLAKMDAPPQTGANIPQPISLRENSTETDLWTRIARLHASDATLDDHARRLIRDKTPTARMAASRAISKTISEDPVMRQIRNLEHSIYEDTARNEYLLRPQILTWLAADNNYRNVDLLNRRVYAELFLTPDSDPWLGLAPNDAYAALESDGLTVQPAASVTTANLKTLNR